MLTSMLAIGKMYAHPKEKILAIIFLVYYRPSMLTSMLAIGKMYAHPKEKILAIIFLVYYRPSILTSMLAIGKIYTQCHNAKKRYWQSFFLYTIGPQC